MRSAGVRLPREGRGSKEGILDVIIGRVATEVRMKAIVAIGHVEGVPLAIIDGARRSLLHIAFAFVIDLPHGEGDVHKIIDFRKIGRSFVQHTGSGCKGRRQGGSGSGSGG